jgi:putative glutamine amidotransferase
MIRESDGTAGLMARRATLHKPVIGITGRRKFGRELAGSAASIADLELDVHFVTYSHEIIRAGGIPIQLPMELDPADAIAVIDALLISGGADVEPTRYGAPVAAETSFETQRDAFEFALLAAANEAAIPVLGICRGCQVVNVHAGGTLNQHVPSHARWNDDPTELIDTVTTVPGTLGHQLYGDTRQVNSLHHQTVAAVGAGLVISGTTADGTVELLEGIDTPVLALQWHPEMMQLDRVDPAFVWLVEQAIQHRRKQHQSDNA